MSYKHKLNFTRFLACLLMLSLMLNLTSLSVFATETNGVQEEQQSAVQEEPQNVVQEETHNVVQEETQSEELKETQDELQEEFDESVAEKRDLSETPSVLSDVSLEGNPVMLDESTISLSASIYDKDPDAGGVNKLTTLVEDGKRDDNTGDLILSDMGQWANDEDRYLYIQLSGVSNAENYELVVTMQPIIQVKSLPDVAGTASRQFTVNTMSVNIGGTFVAEEKNGIQSGTIVWALDEGTEALNFGINLGYDITLWNKLAGELNNNETTPLVSVSIREKNSETVISKVNLHKAQAPERFSETIYTRLDTVTGSSITKYRTEKVAFGLNRMVNGSYSEGFYYPKLVYEIGVPSYTHTDGNTYYLDYDTSSINYLFTSGTVNPTVEEDKDNHKIIITLSNYYNMNNQHFNNLVFSLSEEVADEIEGEDSRAFKGTLKIIQYRNDDDKQGEETPIYSGSTFTINYSTVQLSDVRCATSSPKVATIKPDVVHFLGTYALYNIGYGKSGAYNIQLEFDKNNTNAIHVTTLRVMPDFESEKIVIKYTMVDENGNVMVSDGHYELNNTHYNQTPSNNCTLLFHRGMLDTEHQQYFFKTIEYTIQSIPASTWHYSTGGIKGSTSGGTFWGYVEDSAGTVVENKITVSNIDDNDEKTENKDLTKITKTTLTSDASSNYYLHTASVNGKSSVTEIQAGDSAKISATLSVTQYPYNNTSVLQGIRIGLKLPQGITFDADDVTAKTKNGIPLDVRSVTQPTTEKPIWIIEFEDDATIGYFSETLSGLNDGVNLSFSINLHTDDKMTEQTILLRNVIWAAGDGQSNPVSGNYDTYKVEDTYDLNNTGELDYVSRLGNSEAAALTIKAKPALLDISASLRGSLESTGDLDAALEHFADYVTYDLQIACNDGGSTDNFYYLIPIPKVDSPTNSNFVSMNRVNLELRSKPSMTYSGGAPFKLLYTTESAAGLDYDTASTRTDIWVEESQISDWKQVTMVKVVTDAGTIETGTLSVISLQMYYAGNNYQYQGDAQTYAADAGMTVQFSSRGHYNHEKGSQLFVGSASSNMTTVRLEYTIPETQKITLVAAKDKKPKTGFTTAEVVIDTQFLLEQNYEVRMVNPTNMNIVSSTSDFTKLNSNTDFGITVSLNGGSAADLNENASVTNPITLGTVQSKGTAKFTFEIFNGNALSDTVTPRIVELDIIGHNGVTIPVEITILVEAAPVENATVSILDYKEYLPFDGKESVSISQNSALTAQFVANDLNPNTYTERILSFDSNPANGTTILMIDWTDRTSPKYYNYVLDGNTKTIPLTEFTSLDTGNYSNPTDPEGQLIIKEETLLFIVDFPDVQEQSKKITLTRNASENSGVSDLEQSLNYSVSDKRTFNLTVPEESVSLNQEFSISYNNTAPSTTDNYFNNRKMALVISAKDGSALPVDTRLVLGDQTYYLNAQNQFIIPLGSLSIADSISDSQKIRILSETLALEYTLKAELYVSATANDSQPMKGDLTAVKEFTIIPSIQPAFKVTGLSKRLFVLGEDEVKADLSYEIQNIEGCKVFVEVQKKSGVSGSGYATDDFYLASLNGTSATSTKMDITNMINDTGKLELVFQELGKGTYRILFTIQKDGTDLYTVPYNFLVIND